MFSLLLLDLLVNKLKLAIQAEQWFQEYSLYYPADLPCFLTTDFISLTILNVFHTFLIDFIKFLCG